MEQDVHGHQSFELWRQVLEIDRFREVLRGSPIGLLEATGLASASHVLVGVTGLSSMEVSLMPCYIPKHTHQASKESQLCGFY